MTSCVCKILFKSEQICGCCCKMLRGSLFWDIRYIVCLFISSASPLILFLHFFLTYLLPYLFLSEHTRSASRPDVVKATKHGFSFFVCLFCVVIHFFLLFCQVQFFHAKPRDRVESDVQPQLNQSENANKLSVCHAATKLRRTLVD